MKNNIKKILALMLATVAIICMGAVPAFAASTPDVWVNDTKVSFPDAQPFVDTNNRTLIPVRFVTEAMKANVSWIQETQTAVIEKDGTKVEITIGKKDIKITKNNATQTVVMDTAAVSREARTYVPIRFVAEALGAYVDYSNLYQLVEIVMPDEVTAAEMKRLRSYPMNQTLDLASHNNSANAWWANKEEYKSFTGNYWFTNSHLFLVTMDKKLGYEAKNQFDKTKVTANTNALDYARYVVQYTEDEVETSSYPSSTGKFNLPGYWNLGSGSAAFRTDDALCYQMICPPQAIVSVRGILEYTPKTERGAKYLTMMFEETSPEIGKTYSYDVEFQVYINSRYYLDATRAYWLKPDGAVKPVTAIGITDVK